MGKKVATKLSFFRACYICFLAVFIPSHLKKIERLDNEDLNNAPPDNEPRIQAVHRAFWNSLGLILLFGALGGGAGLLLKCLVGSAPRTVIIFLQILGALFLLWGTLFVRGFEIESYCCVTLSERVNQWLYRALYCIGTALSVCSLAWSGI